MSTDSLSILWRDAPDYAPYNEAVFADLNIDQIIRRVTKDRERYRLDEFYAQRPNNHRDVLFRLEITRALRQEDCREAMRLFLQQFALMRRCLHYGSLHGDPSVAEKWRLDAAGAYMRAVDHLSDGLHRGEAAEGFRLFGVWLEAFNREKEMTRLRMEAQTMEQAFDSVRYAVELDIAAERVRVLDDVDATDYGAMVIRALDRFELRDVPEIVALADIRMSDFELRMLKILKTKHPALFKQLHLFHEACPPFPDSQLEAFERELQFYMTFLDHLRPLEQAGFRFAQPDITDADDGEMEINGGFDLSLAFSTLGMNVPIVPNDIRKSAHENCFVLTGPNQGGKTTFARMFGQVIYFASLGFPVPCASAKLPCPAGLYTHFAIEEDMRANAGRLMEELTRLAHIVRDAPERSVIILNELFSSTTNYDAHRLGRRVLDTFAEKGQTCLYVTHISQLAGEQDAVSLVACVDERDGRKTFRIARKPADGRAYAAPLLEKHRLSARAIKERVHAAAAFIP